MASDDEVKALMNAVIAFQKAGQEVRNAAAVALVDKNLRITVEQAQQFQETCLLAQVDGAKAEWYIGQLDRERARISVLLGVN